MKQDKNIDRFIKKNLRTEKPSTSFSNELMQQIHALENENEKVLSSLLQKHSLEKPSVNFTSRIMREINAVSSQSVYQPVISKKVWFVIFSVILSFVIFAIFNFDNTAIQVKYIDGIVQKMSESLSYELPELISSPLMALSMFALSSLLILDRFLHRKEYA